MRALVEAGADMDVNNADVSKYMNNKRISYCNLCGSANRIESTVIIIPSHSSRVAIYSTPLPSSTRVAKAT